MIDGAQAGETQPRELRLVADDQDLVSERPAGIADLLHERAKERYLRRVWQTLCCVILVLALATLPRVEPRGKRVFRRLKNDKKTTNGVVHFVLPTRIGAAEIVSEVPDGAVVQAIEELRYLSRA